MGASGLVQDSSDAWPRPRPGLRLTLEPESLWAGPLGHLQKGAQGSRLGRAGAPPEE
ncbi:unnamed protein product [Gulo gulo]|uniref:Uncharacterized protein n=1 Tax=Gulo gulo TaxID=48420 RepID=A0A9X9LHG7_GULGU|nr:unnamed protein product [Gulo gulo]